MTFCTLNSYDREPSTQLPLRKPRQLTASPSASPSRSKAVDQIEKNIEKCRSNLQILRDFKTRSESQVPQLLQELENERKKTTSELEIVRRHHVDDLQAYSAQCEAQLKEITEGQLFAADVLKPVLSQLSTARSQTVQIRSQFTIGFASFMEDFKASRTTAIQVCRNIEASARAETVDSVKSRIADLQNAITIRCSKIARAIGPADRGTLSVSLTFSYESDPPTPVPVVERQRVACVSDYMLTWFANNKDVFGA